MFQVFSRRALACIVLSAVTALATGGASRAGGDSGDTIFSHTYVQNDTDKYAWVDVSWAYKTTKWNIDKAFCVAPHSRESHHIQFNFARLGAEIRVRAEVKRGNCGSSNIEMVQERTSLGASYTTQHRNVYATLDKPNSGYRMRLELK
jgi:hypothetical protein